ncbi:RecX family transcriptional regulator [Patescibacteria group bacterium]|nr:RecX family transcriptional regulator [Patescibacteria group bacterium]
MDDFEKSYNRVLHFLSFRPRSEKEIKDYLNKKKVEPSIVEKVINNLKEHRFINDIEFASWWIDQRTRVKPRAWKIIQYELKQKGINEEIIQNSKLRTQNDLESAKILVQKKSLRYMNLPKQEAYQKLGRFLASKGFDWGVIKKALSNIDD